MYKRDKAIRDINDMKEIEDIILRSTVCHVGMIDGNAPYVLAFNFGYEDRTIWLHCAPYGRKIEILKKNPRVYMTFNVDNELFSRHEKMACSWRMRYRSVHASGSAIIIENNEEEKLKGLRIFMKHYSPMDFEFSAPSVNAITIIKIPVDHLNGRKFEYL
jgi:uncharacterized protein